MKTLLRKQKVKLYNKNKEVKFAGTKLNGFDNKQTEDYAFIEAIYNKIAKKMLYTFDHGSYNITELLTFSILSRMIKKRLPSLNDKMETNVADLYQSSTDMWINREDYLSQMTSDERRMFLWQLALTIFKRKSGLSLHYSQLDKPERVHKKENSTATHDCYQQEVAKCPFVFRDKHGYYSFVHKSFMEFFLSQYFFHELKNNFRIANAFNQETKIFL